MSNSSATVDAPPEHMSCTDKQNDVEYEIQSAAASLLQRVIQIPSNILNRLVKSVTTPRNDVTLLQRKDNPLHAALATWRQRLGQNFPDSFLHFQELPTELRLKIWTLAESVPRVVAIGATLRDIETACLYDLLPTSPASPLLRVCGESRFAALKVRPPHRFSETVRGRHGSCPPEVFVDLDRDLLWLCHPDDYLYAFAQILVTDALQESPRLVNSLGGRIRKLAISCLQWHKFHIYAYDILYGLRSLGLDELIVVVRGERSSRTDDVVFVSPRCRPKDVFPRETDYHPGGGQISWPEFEKDVNERFQHLQVKKALDLGLDPGLDLSGWTIRSIFVEAMTGKEFRSLQGSSRKVQPMRLYWS